MNYFLDLCVQNLFARLPRRAVGHQDQQVGGRGPRLLGAPLHLHRGHCRVQRLPRRQVGHHQCTGTSEKCQPFLFLQKGNSTEYITQKNTFIKKLTFFRIFDRGEINTILRL